LTFGSPEKGGKLCGEAMLGVRSGPPRCHLFDFPLGSVLPLLQGLQRLASCPRSSKPPAASHSGIGRRRRAARRPGRRRRAARCLKPCRLRPRGIYLRSEVYTPIEGPAMAKQPITPLRLSKRARSQLERMSTETGCSMTDVVEQLLDGAITRPERWPLKWANRPPARGAAWRALRVKGKGPR